MMGTVFLKTEDRARGQFLQEKSRFRLGIYRGLNVVDVRY